MQETAAIRSWAMGEVPTILESIHKREVNIALFNRDITPLNEELLSLAHNDFEFRFSGDFQEISNAVTNADMLNDYTKLRRDIKDQLSLFNQVAKAESYRLYLATISSNMCRKFHTDINDLRLLCTYVGPGTLWLTEDDEKAVEDCCDDDGCIEKSRIQEAETGSVIILKGAIYPKEGTRPVLHRSPTIEEGGEKRILLRIDTDEFANF